MVILFLPFPIASLCVCVIAISDDEWDDHCEKQLLTHGGRGHRTI
jgi:hypothetical protein